MRNTDAIYIRPDASLNAVLNRVRERMRFDIERSRASLPASLINAVEHALQQHVGQVMSRMGYAIDEEAKH